MPFFPSAQHDDGYDVCDYYSIDPRLGDLGDFTEFIRTAQALTANLARTSSTWSTSGATRHTRSLDAAVPESDPYG